MLAFFVLESLAALALFGVLSVRGIFPRLALGLCFALLSFAAAMDGMLLFVGSHV